MSEAARASHNAETLGGIGRAADFGETAFAQPGNVSAHGRVGVVQARRGPR